MQNLISLTSQNRSASSLAQKVRAHEAHAQVVFRFCFLRATKNALKILAKDASAR